MTATVTPDNATSKSVSWKSSKPTVAFVDENGKVTALAGGTATITATTSNGLTATCEVTVTVPVSGVSLDQASLELNTGATKILVATISPSDATTKDVTWTSGNPEIAKVDANGKITAVSSGTATITVTTKNGEKEGYLQSL